MCHRSVELIQLDDSSQSDFQKHHFEGSVSCFLLTLYSHFITHLYAEFWIKSLLFSFAVQQPPPPSVITQILSINFGAGRKNNKLFKAYLIKKKIVGFLLSGASEKQLYFNQWHCFFFFFLLVPALLRQVVIFQTTFCFGNETLAASS